MAPPVIVAKLPLTDCRVYARPRIMSRAVPRAGGDPASVTTSSVPPIEPELKTFWRPVRPVEDEWTRRTEVESSVTAPNAEHVVWRSTRPRLVKPPSSQLRPDRASTTPPASFTSVDWMVLFPPAPALKLAPSSMRP